MMTKRIVLVVVVFFVSIFSLFLRLRYNALVPLPGESVDEYSNTWVGQSLLTFGVPIGISSDLKGYETGTKAYVNVDEIYHTRGGDPFILRQKWFDHPPMTGLITAAYSWLRGGRVFEDASTIVVRKPVVVAGVFSTLAVFFLGLEIYSFRVAILASILFTISPTVLFGSRPAQAENFFIPLTLWSLFFLYRFLKNHRVIYVVLAGCLAGLATLFKLTSIYCWLASIIIIATKLRRQKLGWEIIIIIWGYFLISALPIALLFVTYGLAIDWPLFVKVLSGNTQRGFAMGLELFGKLIQSTKIGFRTISDPWITLSWLVALVSLSKTQTRNQDLPLKIIFFCYLLFIVILSGNGYSWYFLPFYPITFLFLANIIFELFDDRRKYFVIYFFSMVILGTYCQRLISQPVPSFVSLFWQLFSLITLIVYMAHQLVYNCYLVRVVLFLTCGIFASAVVSTFWYGWTMTPALWFQVY